MSRAVLDVQIARLQQSAPLASLGSIYLVVFVVATPRDL